MRKWILAPIIVIMAFFISEFSEATFEGVFLGDSNLYENLQLQSGKLLKDIIVLPDEKYDKIKASEIINRLDHLPYSVLQKIKKNDIKIVLFNGILTDQANVEESCSTFRSVTSPRELAGGRSPVISSSWRGTASNSEPSGRVSMRVVASSARSTGARSPRPEKYERTRARRSVALPT